MRSRVLLDVELARCVLQRLDMDAEYEGNVEAAMSYKNLTWMTNMKAMSRPPQRMLNMRQCRGHQTRLLGEVSSYQGKNICR